MNFKYDKMKRHFCHLLTVFIAAACDGPSCDDPPAGTELPEAMDPVEVAGCAEVGPTAEEFTQGVSYQCTGAGAPEMKWTLTCTGSNLVCNNDGVQNAMGEDSKDLFNFSFGEEAYQDLAVAACCEEGVDEERAISSCDYACNAMVCENVNAYISFVRSNNDEMRELCCDKNTDGDGNVSYDCQDGELLKICRNALDAYIEETAAEGWVDYCKGQFASGADSVFLAADPDVETVLGAVISFRDVEIMPHCAIDDTYLPPASEPIACGTHGYNQLPEDWPEGAGTPRAFAMLRRANTTAQVHLDSPLSKLLTHYNLPAEFEKPVSGRIAYSYECESAGCGFVLNNMYIESDEFGESSEYKNHAINFLAYKSYGYLNEKAWGEITSKDASGNLHFSIPAGQIRFAFIAGGKVWSGDDGDEATDMYIGGSSDNEVTGFITPDGRVTVNQIEIQEGNVYIAFSFTSEVPNHAPTALYEVIESGCPHGRLTTLDASASYDLDGDTLSYEWRWNDQVISTAPSFDYEFPQGVQAVYLTVWDDENHKDTVRVTVFSRDCDVLVIANEDYVQESYLIGHLQDRLYDVHVVSDDFVDAATSLESYDFVLVSAMSPGLSDFALDNLKNAGKPMIVVEHSSASYWSYKYSYKLGLVSAGFGLAETTSDSLTPLTTAHYLTPPDGADVQVYYGNGTIYAAPIHHVYANATPLFESPCGYAPEKVAVLADDTRKIVVTGAYDTTLYSAQGWDLFDVMVDYLFE